MIIFAVLNTQKMRILVQRVTEASVTIGGSLKSAIGRGLLVLVGITDTDTDTDIDYLASKLVNLRIFDDAEGVMNLSAADTQAEILIVSQFTLYASTRKGNRPSYIRASKPDFAVPMYEQFCSAVSEKLGREVGTGTFGADMQVSLINDGPVTIWIDSDERK